MLELQWCIGTVYCLHCIMVRTEIYHMIQSGILTKWVFATFTEMQSSFSFPLQNMLNNNHLVIKPGS